MNLKELNEFCEKFSIDPITVTFEHGWIDVYVCLNQEDFEKVFPPEPEYSDYTNDKEYDKAMEIWQELENTNPYCRGECEYSIRI